MASVYVGSDDFRIYACTALDFMVSIVDWGDYILRFNDFLIYWLRRTSRVPDKVSRGFSIADDGDSNGSALLFSRLLNKIIN